MLGGFRLYGLQVARNRAVLGVIANQTEHAVAQQARLPIRCPHSLPAENSFVVAAPRCKATDLDVEMFANAFRMHLYQASLAFYIFSGKRTCSTSPSPEVEGSKPLMPHLRFRSDP